MSRDPAIDIRRQIEKLSPEKRALLEERLAGLNRNGASKPTPIRALERRIHPLSFAQRRLWFIQQLDSDSAAYNVPAVYTLQGFLDVEMLETSLNDVIRRHSILRTNYEIWDGRPVQVVAPERHLRIQFRDLSSLPDSQRSTALDDIVVAEVHRPFDLGKDLLLRALVVRLADEIHTLVLNLHHIVTDEWSTEILYRELSHSYAARLDGSTHDVPDLRLQYGDFASWQRNAEESDGPLRHRAYWIEKLRGSKPARLEPDTPRTTERPPRGEELTIELPGRLRERCALLGREERSSLFMVLLAALKAVIHEVTESSDVAVGSPATGRTRDELEDLIGFFVNTLVLRTDVNKSLSFRELVRRVRETVLDAEAHQDYPFDKIVEELRPNRDEGRPQLFQLMASFQNEAGAALTLPGIEIERYPLRRKEVKFDLSVFFTRAGDGVEATIRYDANLFERETVSGFMRRFLHLLDASLDAPDEPITAVASGPRPEEPAADFGEYAMAVRTDYPSDQSVVDLFARRVSQAPQAIAIEHGDRTIRYAELDAQAEILARRIRETCSTASPRVGLALKRSADSVIATLAVLKAGGVYVPLDPAYPSERIRFMIDDADVSLLIRQGSRSRESGLPRAIPCIDMQDAGLENCDSDALPAPVPSADDSGPLDPAYIMYTSGSTGTPKGVVVPHRAIVRLVVNTNYISINPEDVVAHASNISFDASTFEIWGALLNGARIRIVDQEDVLSPGRLSEFLQRSGTSVLFLTTALFNTVVRHRPDAFRTLRYVLFGGEKASAHAARLVHEHGPPAHLLNVYGPTENTTFTTWYRIDGSISEIGDIPIGRPISNTTVAVLNQERMPVPRGTVGELFVGGDGLAREYLGRPDLTSAVFVHVRDESLGHTRMYRTGDMVRWNRRGELEFVGRSDRQVKIRGFRIEPDEIEAVLESHPAIESSAVRIDDGNDGVRKITAFVAVGDSTELSSASVHEFLAKKLPAYMRPSSLTILPSLPLSPNGKIDVRALPTEPIKPERSDRQKPRTDTETRLLSIWQNLLGRDDLGLHDDFFQVGGHSLLAVQLFADIEKTFDRDLSIGTIFSASTIEALADVIDSKDTSGPSSDKPVVGATGAPATLFCVHGVSSDTLRYQPLVSRLSARVEARWIQGEGLDGSRITYRSVEELAARHAETIRSSRADGPITLLGFCYGGLIAFEVAIQLEKAHVPVDHVILVDSVSPYSRGEYAGETAVDRLRRVTNPETNTGGPGLLTRLRNHGRYRFAQVRRAADRLAARLYVTLGKRVPRRLRLQYILSENTRRISRYRPAAYRGAVTVFRSSENHHRLNDLGWGELVSGPLHVHVVHGDHNLFDGSSVDALAREIQHILEGLPDTK